MLKIKNFLRLRKQNDNIKVASLFIIFGICFFVNSMYITVKLIKKNTTSMEIEVVDEVGGLFTTNQLNYINSLDNVIVATKVKKETLSIEYANEEIPIECVFLSANYIEKAYGITNISVNEFYCNNKALELFSGASADSMKRQSLNNGIIVRYTLNDSNIKCKLFFVDKKLPEEKPYIVSVGENKQYINAIVTGRIKINKRVSLEKIKKELYDNRIKVIEEESLNKSLADKKYKLVCIRYNLLLSILSIFFGFFTYKISTGSK